MVFQQDPSALPFGNQDRAKDFYVDRLGMSVIADMHMGPHGRWLQVAPAGAATSLALVPGDDSSAPGSATIEADIAQLRERGMDLPEQIEDMPWARAIRFTDPDGNHLVLQNLGRRSGLNRRAACGQPGPTARWPHTVARTIHYVRTRAHRAR